MGSWIQQWQQVHFWIQWWGLFLFHPWLAVQWPCPVMLTSSHLQRFPIQGFTVKRKPPSGQWPARFNQLHIEPTFTLPVCPRCGFQQSGSSITLDVFDPLHMTLIEFSGEMLQITHILYHVTGPCMAYSSGGLVPAAEHGVTIGWIAFLRIVARRGIHQQVPFASAELNGCVLIL